MGLTPARKLSIQMYFQVLPPTFVKKPGFLTPNLFTFLFICFPIMLYVHMSTALHFMPVLEIKMAAVLARG